MDTTAFSQLIERYCSILKQDYQQNILDIPEKLQIITFLINKLHSQYYITDENLTLFMRIATKLALSKKLQNPLFYLNFKHTKLIYKINLNLWYELHENLTTNFTIIESIQIIKSLIDSEFCSFDMKMYIVVHFANQISQTSNIYRLEFIRVLNNSSIHNNDFIQLLIQDLRNISHIVKPTLYTDKHNVHDSTINTSVLHASHYLITNYENKDYNWTDIKNFYIKLTQNINDQIQIKKTITKIQMDIVKFTYKKQKFQLRDVFLSLLKYIDLSNNKEELNNRLIEELKEMDEKCSTGHLSRLINVCQGIDIDENLQIKISDYEQLKARIFHYLTTELMNSPIHIQEKIDDISINKDVLLYIKNKINDKKIEGDSNMICKILKLYTLVDWVWKEEGGYCLEN